MLFVNYQLNLKSYNKVGRLNDKDKQHKKLNYYHLYGDVGINDNIGRVVA
jgi:hypothetical protein